MDRLHVITQHINWFLEKKDRVIVAIDGKCTAGKTTTAAELAKLCDCNVIHMDDFFLRPEQRTAERYAQTGGNVDYERFREEVLIPLQTGRAFTYRPFNCKTLQFSDPVTVEPKKLTVIEGSYAMHPYFGEPYDLKILLTVDADTQYRRILKRPAFLQEQFFARWIPMENAYLDAFRISEKADLVL